VRMTKNHKRFFVNDQGKHYTVQNAGNEPAPVQKPRPPIMIGGDGEKVTLKLVAHKYAVLRAHCEAVGRPYDDITRTNFIQIVIARDEADLAAKRIRYPKLEGIIGTPDMLVEQLAEYAKIGSQHILFHMPKAETIEPLLMLGETVLPHVAAL